MASKQASKTAEPSALIAPLTPDSWDPDAAEDATNPAVHAALQEGLRSEKVSADEVRRRIAATPEEIAEARAELARQEQRRRRPTGARPTAANGKVLLRLPLSVHQELIARAEAEQTSLNQLVLAYVSRGLGQDAGPAVR